MIEGGGSDDFATVQDHALRRGPTCCTASLDVNAQAVAEYLNAQIDAGAQAVMIFDTWGGMLSARGLPRVLAGVPDAGRRRRCNRARTADACRRIVFTKGGGVWLETSPRSAATRVGLDWTVDIGDARRRVGDTRRAAGQSRPAVLFTDRGDHRARGDGDRPRGRPAPGHIFNLGHGICRRRRPSTSACWSRRSIGNRARCGRPERPVISLRFPTPVLMHKRRGPGSRAYLCTNGCQGPAMAATRRTTGMMIATT